MKKTIFLLMVMLTSTLFSQTTDWQIPMLVGSTKVEGFPIVVNNIPATKDVNKSKCPVLQYIVSKKEEFKNWRVVNSDNKVSYLTDMRLEKINNIYVLLIQTKDYVVSIKTFSSEILKFTDKEFYFHNGDGKIIKIEKQS